jgi:hypothetical protein
VNVPGGERIEKSEVFGPEFLMLATVIGIELIFLMVIA